MTDPVPADQPPAPAVEPREKVKTFPTTPGVYLMKDDRGRVIYVGKAVNLRSRAGSYFTKQALEDRRTFDLVPEIRDIDFVPTESEVDALLLEARLIKDIQPRFNSDLKDDKTFPYLQIHTREQFPRVEFTRKPRLKGVKLYGPFTSASNSAERSPYCSRSSGSGTAPSTSARKTNAGAGSAPASWRASTSAPPPATSASPARTTARICGN